MTTARAIPVLLFFCLLPMAANAYHVDVYCTNELVRDAVEASCSRADTVHLPTYSYGYSNMASSDLATGELKVFASSFTTSTFYLNQVSAFMEDDFSFASDSAFDAELRMSVHGMMWGDLPTRSTLSALSANLHLMDETNGIISSASVNTLLGQGIHVTEPDPNSTLTFGGGSQFITTLTDRVVNINLVVPFRWAPGDEFTFAASLAVTAPHGDPGSIVMDFSNTASLFFNLPEDVQLVSGSGALLSARVVEVSEPSSLALIAIAFSGMMALRRRRSTHQPIH